MGSYQIEGEPAQDGEFLGGSVISRLFAVLGEGDIEQPVLVVFDEPVRADHTKRFGRIEDAGERIVSYPRGLLAADPARGIDAGDGGKPGEGNWSPHLDRVFAA